MTTRLPIFPLGTVLFPGSVLPLHIFEERYRLLVRHLIEQPSGPRRFGVVGIREGREVGTDGIRALYDVGCVTEVRQIKAYDDGRFDLLTRGTRPFRLLAVDDSQAWLTGDLELLDHAAAGAGASDAGRQVRGLFERYTGELQRYRVPETEPDDLPGDAERLSYAVAAAMVLDKDDKQRLLAAPTAAERLRLEVDLLRREIAVLGRLPALPATDFPRQPYSIN